ncbi:MULTISPECIES: hypothetical protein [Streptomycetaceae]|uniref:Uncharacterized protein n=1 Tax=Streptantibioticus cattleyicolor (strain ATCC 35852 / DSM 46488 / JCM 4925 / NBRC 14057 / NRRL 8057) TaxID=1003195 RepID=F8JS58_STREN|nr:MULTISPECIES: hypothetical protein [Streptomycetaceae]AEW94166.1 hypothetical protein SCATT_17950 [Streptantibioticus cattleyicolor NRRL 8057 = DSM 46488]MYS58831.1 hypothetical protein [Streptomyces sp. SID5468]CCB74522.1 protein of unknown function [Streptantibioticus cattleyicolor NRRL 8057 = DSM 46488]
MAVVTNCDAAATENPEPLLSYTLTTDPDPLKASPEHAEEPVTGQLLIAGSRAARPPMDVEWIKVKVPAGEMAPDLAKAENPRTTLDGWTGRLNAATKEFEFTPTGAYGTIGPDTGFTIQLSRLPINHKVGTAPITIPERSRTGDDPFANRSTTFNGGEVTLTWERSDIGEFELLYGQTSERVTDTTRTITGITADTAFYLRGTAGDPSNPVIRTLTAHVTVNKPHLTTGNLEVQGAANLIGRPTELLTVWPNDPKTSESSLSTKAVD